MKIRGAGEIARSAAEALLIAARESKANDAGLLFKDVGAASRLLLETRPTAVSLPNSIRYITIKMRQAQLKTSDVEKMRSLVIKTAQDFVKNSKKSIQIIGEIGSRRIQDGDVLLTHCNSSAVTSIIKTAWAQGKKIRVFVTETRPKFQGLITAKLLAKAGIPVTLIVDSAAHFLMTKLDTVLVGADVVTSNGAVVNKIGTSMIALAAHEARVGFFVATETYKLSPETMIGDLVDIEERESAEIISQKNLEKMPGVAVRNPAFDVTPAKYIDLIITERGIIPPQGAITLIREVFGAISIQELLNGCFFERTE
jgi:ribose 1,5-bisphosphate isomerase